MKNAIFLTAAILVSTGLVACDNSSAKNEADKAVTIEAGDYQATIDCGNAEKNAKLPNIEMVYSLKADGTYSETADVEVESGAKISMVLNGTFEATTSSFTFNQQGATTADGSTVLSDVRASKKLTVIEYVKSEGKIVLRDEANDNACNGKMLFVLTKK